MERVPADLEKARLQAGSWYFVDAAGETKGPFTPPALHKASHFKDCHVWREGMAEWAMKSTVPELQQVAYELAVPGYREEQARRRQKAIVKDGKAAAVSPLKRSPLEPARVDFADDPAPEVVFPGKSFCLSGNFLYGTRQKCVDAIAARGGIVDDKPTVSTDYVVIGTMANPEWANGNYGRKIEHALELRIAHGRPAIIAESTFTQAL